MQSTGEKVQATPVLRISRAVTRPISSISSAFQLELMPSWVGKIVAPGQNEWPWIASTPSSSGMPIVSTGTHPSCSAVSASISGA